MAIAATLFVLALLTIIALFLLKAVEERSARRFAPLLRARADRDALRLKATLLNSRHQIAKLPPLLVLLTRYALHEGALGLAALGRMLEREAYRLADFASHKRGFERKETKSQFLKEVKEFKNGTPEEEL